jgi:hypothetical protein
LISTCEFGVPPIGIVVKSRGEGSPTDCPNETDGTLDTPAPINAAKTRVQIGRLRVTSRRCPRRNGAATLSHGYCEGIRQSDRQSKSVIVRLMIEQEFFGTD